MNTPAISVSNLSKRYGDVLAVNDASFEVPLGTICGFVGPNGSGKTTTIRMLLGLIKPSSGTGSIIGNSIGHPEKYLKEVGAMIEGPAFYPALSGLENLKVLAKLGGIPLERCQQLLDLVDLGERGGDKYKTYSLGMKQRLGIAAALLPNPKLLILDEPTNGLDPAGIQEIRDLLEKLASEGVTVFVSSHLLSELEMISKHLVMLRKGEVIFSGPIQELLQRNKPTIVAKPTSRNSLPYLAEIINKTGHVAVIEDDHVRVDADEAFAVTLNKLAFESGIVLAQLTPVRASLEETFFELTGGQS
ncbi:MAG: ABC transporter ATP-binding protein [Actinomycetales bacterium]|jgi:ABC-2 type transport system ATP-binding protein|nr:ABC transporter ATP-binding protein [Actinomycetales bacterium]